MDLGFASSWGRLKKHTCVPKGHLEITNLKSISGSTTSLNRCLGLGAPCSKMAVLAKTITGSTGARVHKRHRHVTQKNTVLLASTSFPAQDPIFQVERRSTSVIVTICALWRVFSFMAACRDPDVSLTERKWATRGRTRQIDPLITFAQCRKLHHVP
jgi:hypothetical protein